MAERNSKDEQHSHSKGENAQETYLLENLMVAKFRAHVCVRVVLLLRRLHLAKDDVALRAQHIGELASKGAD